MHSGARRMIALSMWMVAGLAGMGQARAQAVGPVAEGGALTFRNHGTPGKQYLMLGALSRFDTPVFATIGPWWLESPFFDLFIFSFDATGQHGLTIPIAGGGSPSLVGLEVHLQSFQEQFAAEPITSYVLSFTIE